VQPSRYRDLFPLREDDVFLDHAGVAPVSTRVADAVRRFLDEATADGARRYPYWKLRVEEVRSACARLVGVETARVAFVKNTSEGLSFVARGLPWRGGDAVLLADREFPSNVYPWWALAPRGVEARFITPGEAGIDAGAVERALDDTVRVVALSAIAYGTGERLQLEAIGRLCRERGVLFVVDGAQALGAVAIDLERERLDCVVADGHKWLCAPEGAGFMALSENLLDRLEPIELGWKSVVAGDEAFYPYDLRLRRDAAKLEAGSLNVMAIHGLGAAVELALEVGLEEIESRLGLLTDALVAGLSERGRPCLGRREPARPSGIVTFVPHGDPERVRQELWSRGVVARSRFGGLRLSPHHYQDDGDIARFFERYDAAEATI
jgi:selenocysteine lyase/cysteine desulfurase